MAGIFRKANKTTENTAEAPKFWQLSCGTAEEVNKAKKLADAYNIRVADEHRFENLPFYMHELYFECTAAQWKTLTKAMGVAIVWGK